MAFFRFSCFLYQQNLEIRGLLMKSCWHRLGIWQSQMQLCLTMRIGASKTDICNLTIRVVRVCGITCFLANKSYQIDMPSLNDPLWLITVYLLIIYNKVCLLVWQQVFGQILSGTLTQHIWKRINNKMLKCWNVLGRYPFCPCFN
jgi:hypothetical protein